MWGRSPDLPPDAWSGFYGELFIQPASLANMATTTTWWTYNGGYPSQSLTYDIAGNVLTATDPNTVFTQQDQNTSGDAALKSQALYDGLGRAIESDTFESASQYVVVTTSYDSLKRLAGATNPEMTGSGTVQYTL